MPQTSTLARIFSRHLLAYTTAPVSQPPSAKMAAVNLPLVFVAFSLAFCDIRAYDDEEEVLLTSKREPVDCVSSKHVCQTLMKYNTGEVMDEDPYCTCDNCLPEWRRDGKGLEWIHYERKDYSVMYRFCEPLEKRESCLENQTALHIETDLKGWNPRIKRQYCTCEGQYHLMGWRKIHGTWRYNYRCKKHQCGKVDACVKHFVNGLGKTTGYKFLCECEDGMHCPTEHEYNNNNVETDDNGDRYIYDYCEVNLGRRKRSAKYKNKNSA